MRCSLASPRTLGLYAATFPLIANAVFETSRYLAKGPVALASLLVAASIQEITNGAGLTNTQHVGYAVLITVAAGLLQILIAVSQLGNLVNLLSHPVV